MMSVAGLLAALLGGAGGVETVSELENPHPLLCVPLVRDVFGHCRGVDLRHDGRVAFRVPHPKAVDETYLVDPVTGELESEGIVVGSFRVGQYLKIRQNQHVDVLQASGQWVMSALLREEDYPEGCPGLEDWRMAGRQILAPCALGLYVFEPQPGRLNRVDLISIGHGPGPSEPLDLHITENLAAMGGKDNRYSVLSRAKDGTWNHVRVIHHEGIKDLVVGGGFVIMATDDGDLAFEPLSALPRKLPFRAGDRPRFIAAATRSHYLRVVGPRNGQGRERVEVIHVPSGRTVRLLERPPAIAKLDLPRLGEFGIEPRAGLPILQTTAEHALVGWPVMYLTGHPVFRRYQSTLVYVYQLESPLP